MKARMKSVCPVLIVFFSLSAGYIFAALNPKVFLPVAPKKVPAPNEVVKTASFVGSNACIECHQEEQKIWSMTWHAKMLRKTSPEIVVADFNNLEISYPDVEVQDANKQRVKITPTIGLKREGNDYFLTLVDRDDETNNQTYKLAYVLGGNWEQQFEAQVGSRFYPSPMRWVVADNQWRSRAFSEIWWVADGTPDGRPRRPEEMQGNQGSDAKCDGCHTTGLKARKENEIWTLPDRDAGLGIGCERCHGPGSKHVELGTKESIINPLRLNQVQEDQVCGQCHSRVTNKTVADLAYPLDFLPANTDLQDRVEFWTYSTRPMNFWPNEYASKNRQQYQDEQKSAHARAGVTCITCHTSHAPGRVDANLRVAGDGSCRQCHEAAAEVYHGSPTAKAGATCTNCHMAKIANRAGATKKVKEHWDVSSHTFTVVMPYIADSYTMRSSCDACHTGDDRGKYGLITAGRQSEVQKKIDETSALIQEKSKAENTLKARDGLNKVLLDGSLGAHNYEKTMELLTGASKSLGGK